MYVHASLSHHSLCQYLIAVMWLSLLIMMKSCRSAGGETDEGSMAGEKNLKLTWRNLTQEFETERMYPGSVGEGK